MAVTTLIGTVTVGAGGAASITFSSIAADYTDLKLVHSIRTNRSVAPSEGIGMNLNGSTSNQSMVNLEGNNGSIYTGTGSILFTGAASTSFSTANTFGNSSVYLPNYASSNFKSVSAEGVSENNSSNAAMFIQASLWSDTSAVTSITLIPLNGGTLFLEYSTASLYGIKYD
tara:strand:+ start:483 stop:995 length:513 start_codon:yes stop_codon:yes gene_type:complete